MKIIQLEQNTPEWHQYRNTRIGASDFALFACHKGLSKPIFNVDLNTNIYNKRNNVQLKSNKYMEHGHNREPFLRDYYAKKHDVICEPLVIQCDDFDDLLFASLDGYDPFNNGGLEVKTTLTATADKFEEKMQYYIFQIAHQIYVGNLNYIDVVFEFSDGEIVEKRYFMHDLPINIHEWRELCWEYLEILKDAGGNNEINLLEQYHNLGMEIKTLEDKRQIIFNKIKELNISGVYGDFIVKESERKTCKYADYFKDNNIVIDDDRYYTVSKSLKITKKGVL